MEELLSVLVEEMTSRYCAHTIILYGSMADNTANAQSDIDLACFTDGKCPSRDARVFHDKYLDAWLYHTSTLLKADSDFIHLVGGFCLKDEKGLGKEFLHGLKQIFAMGPEALSVEDIEHTKVWIIKSLERAKRGDPEANYRRSWLVSELLKIYFQLRNKWFLGPKKSFVWLNKNDPLAFTLFCELYSTPQDFTQLEKVASYVTRV